MLRRFFGFVAVVVAIGALAYGLYMESRMQVWNSTHSEMLQLEATHGKCTKSKGYGFPDWNCPTEEMEDLKEELRDMRWELSNAEQTRNLSYGMVIAGPLIIMFLGSFTIGLIDTLTPVLARIAGFGRRGVQRAGEFSASTSRRAVSEASRMADSARGRTRECPYCAEMIKPQARVCWHCGRDVS